MSHDAALDAQATQRIEEVGAELLARLTPMADLLYAELIERIDDLRGDPLIMELLRASTAGNLESVAHLLQGHLTLENVEVPATAKEYARRLAQRGTPLQSLLRAYRLGQRRFLDWAFTQLEEREPDATVVYTAARSLTQTTFEYVDRVSEGVVDAYQAERERWLANRNTVRLEVLETLLDGGHVEIATAESALGHRLRQHHLGVVLWRSESGGSTHDLRELEHLLAAIGRAVGAAGSPLFIPRDRATAWGWLPLGRTADRFDLAVITEAVEAAGADVRVAVGTTGASEEGFRTTHVEAHKAHAVAMVSRDRALPVTSYADPGVRAAALLTADLDSTRRLVCSSLGELAVDTEAAGRLRETLLIFLRCNESYVAAADLLHLHKNTVKYRIDKATDARGKSLDESRLDLELALVACQWLGPAVLAST